MKNKPISLKSVFNQAISLYRKFFLVLISTSLLMEVVAKLSPNTFNYTVLFYFLFHVIAYTFIGSVAVVYIDLSRKNHEVGILLSVKKTLNRLLYLLINGLLLILILLPSLLLFIIPGILVCVVFSQMGYFILLENKGPWEAFSLSSRLTKGNRMKISAIYIFIFLSIILGFVLLFHRVPGFYGDSILTSILGTLIGSFSSAFAYSLWRNLRVASSIK